MADIIEGRFPIIIRDRLDLLRWLAGSDRHGLLPSETHAGIARAIEVVPDRPAYGGDWSSHLVPESPRDDVWVDHVVRICVAYHNGLTDYRRDHAKEKE